MDHLKRFFKSSALLNSTKVLIISFLELLSLVTGNLPETLVNDTV